jgi:hypothetical protein
MSKLNINFNLTDPTNGGILTTLITSAVDSEGKISIEDLAKIVTQMSNKNNQYFQGTSDGTITSGNLAGDQLVLVRNIGPVVTIPVDLSTNSEILDIRSDISGINGGSFQSQIDTLDGRVDTLENTSPWIEAELSLSGLSAHVKYQGNAPTLTGDKDAGWVLTEVVGCFLDRVRFEVTDQEINGANSFVVTIDNNQTQTYRYCNPEFRNINTGDIIQRPGADFGMTVNAVPVGTGEVKYTIPNVHAFGSTGVDIIMKF